MPPRIPLAQCLRVPASIFHSTSHILPSTAATSRRTFTSTPSLHQPAKDSKQKQRKHQEPWQLAQAKARRAANISRREVLQKERVDSLGNPVRGSPTPFVHSFNTAQPPSATEFSITAKRDLSDRRNFFLSEEDLTAGIAKSEELFTPTDAQLEHGSDLSNLTVEEEKAEYKKKHDNAEEAIRRISSLSLASNADLHRINTQRIISVFGRHNTDDALPPRPAAPVPSGSETPPAKIPRVGADTGSSEVQIAILTAKIKALADFQESRGRHDKNGKRNLRLLVHRRQKLLKYLERKERGGPRFQNVVEALGLTKGAWVGEITLR